MFRFSPPPPSATALPILEITDESFQIHTANFKTVLAKVGSRPFVLYSINGPTNSGKSFALNFFLRFWEAKKHDNVKNWFDFDPKGKFTWKSGMERTTIGINLWSEPYFVEEHDREVAILLMDTQGLFDEGTSDRENAIIFSLSALCSSVSIFNLLKTLDEPELQRLQFFSGYAHASTEEGAADLDKHSNRNPIEAFQKLLFLVRDFEKTKSYEFGYHDMYWTVPNSPHNFCLDTFVNTSAMSAEAKFLREQILECYKTVGFYLMPTPGQKFLENNAEEVNANFNTHVKAFVELANMEGNLTLKRIGGHVVTGLEFEAYVERWAKLCQQADTHFPQGQTREESTAIVENTLAYGTFTSEYEKRVQNLLETHPTGLAEAEFLQNHVVWQKEALERFFAVQKTGDEEMQAKYGDLLLEHTQHFFEVSLKVNQVREEQKKIDAEKEKAKSAKIAFDEKYAQNQERIDALKAQGDNEQAQEELKQLIKDQEAVSKSFKADVEDSSTRLKDMEKKQKAGVDADNAARIAKNGPVHPAGLSTIKEFILKGVHSMLNKIF